SLLAWLCPVHRERGDSMPKSSLPTGNRLLDRLTAEVSERLLPSLEMVPLPQGYELCKQDGPMTDVYFPTMGVCSVVSVTDDGRVVEAATIGNEGMVGLHVLLGLDFSPSRAISQVSGKGLRTPASAFLEAVKPGGRFDRLLRRYLAFSLRYAYQTVACNAL